LADSVAPSTLPRREDPCMRSLTRVSGAGRSNDPRGPAHRGYRRPLYSQTLASSRDGLDHRSRGAARGARAETDARTRGDRTEWKRWKRRAQGGRSRPRHPGPASRGSNGDGHGGSRRRDHPRAFFQDGLVIDCVRDKGPWPSTRNVEARSVATPHVAPSLVNAINLSPSSHVYPYFTCGSQEERRTPLCAPCGSFH